MIMSLKIYDPKTERIRPFCGKYKIFWLKLYDLLKYTILEFVNYMIFWRKVYDLLKYTILLFWDFMVISLKVKDPWTVSIRSCHWN